MDRMDSKELPAPLIYLHSKPPSVDKIDKTIKKIVTEYSQNINVDSLEQEESYGGAVFDR
jgi:endonuclease V-like protein UPF0215 family